MLTIILKGTNGCNLNCAYCSLGEKPTCDKISEDTLYQALQYVCRVAATRHENEMNLILHGGEPTLISSQIYRNVLSRIRKEYPDVFIQVSMQTNGFTISEGMLQFIKDFHVRVGISIDGSAWIHNQERKGKDGSDTFSQITRNIDFLRNHGVSVSCLMVLTSIGLKAPLDYIEFFAKKRIHLKINPLLNYGEVDKNPYLTLNRGEYANYLIRLYEYVINRDDIEVGISPIDKFIQAALSGDRIRECTFCSDCNQNFLCVDHRGDIYPCGKFSDIHEYKLGNVKTTEGDILNHKKMHDLLQRRKEKLPQKCKGCKFLHQCHAGCNAEAVIENALSQPPRLCEDYLILFEYFRGKGLRLLRNQLERRKQKLQEKNNAI